MESTRNLTLDGEWRELSGLVLDGRSEREREMFRKIFYAGAMSMMSIMSVSDQEPLQVALQVRAELDAFIQEQINRNKTRIN